MKRQETFLNHFNPSSYAYLLFMVFMLPLGIKAQTAYEFLNQNGLSARFNANGQLFWDGKKSSFEAPKGSGHHTLSAAGLWIGGIDQNHISHISAQTYGVGSDFQPGPLDNTGACDSATSSLYNKVWKITRLEIDSFLAGLSTPKSIIDWPANGNTSNGFPKQLAPFIDADGNGTYEPSKGDYPDMKGDVMLWWVFNDGIKHTETSGAPLKMEVQASAYTYNCSGDPVLNNSIFLHYKITNRYKVAFDSFYAGLWSDFDIGNPFNDYIGCDPNTNSYFGYNATNNDDDTTIIRKGDTIFYKGYAEKLPVQSVSFLDGFRNSKGVELQMSSFNYFFNTDDTTAMGFPKNWNEYLNYLSGKWKNGKSLTYGGNGYGGQMPTAYAFPGNPTDSKQWAELNQKNALADRSCIGSYGPMTFQPNESMEVTAAFIFDNSASGKTMKSIGVMQNNITTLQNLYNKNALAPCTGLSTCAMGDTCVWPGDANLDKTADMYDIFHLGYAYGATGPARAISSNQYIAQHSVPWNANFPDGTNFRFADCNGDGKIDSADVLPISLNYGETYHKKGDGTMGKQTDPLLFVDILEDSVPVGGEIHVFVKLGDTSSTGVGVTGVAFDLEYDPTMVDSDGFTYDFNGSWIKKAGNIISVVNNNHGNGTTHGGQSSAYKKNITDTGVIIMYKYVVSDNISGGVKKKITMDISNARAVNNTLSIVPLRTQSDSVKIYDPSTGIEEANTLSRSVNLYPNPAKDEIFINIRNIAPQEMKIHNIYGQEMLNLTSSIPKASNEKENIRVDTSTLPEGIYLLQLQGHGSISMKKFIITK